MVHQHQADALVGDDRPSRGAGRQYVQCRDARYDRVTSDLDWRRPKTSPEFGVAFGDRRITFHPAGTNLIGFRGRIDVRTTRPNPLFQDAILMVPSDPSGNTWKLVTVNERFKTADLTDQALQDLLEQALL